MGDKNCHDKVKDVLRNHSGEVGLVTMSVCSAVAGMMYSEYLRNFKKTIRPTMKVWVPETSQIDKLLEIGSPFANEMADTLVDRMLENPLLSFRRLGNDKLFLFRDEHLDTLRTIIETYVIPHVARYVPSVIRAKFGLDDDSVQTFIESNELDMFDRAFPLEHHHRFIADETVLHLLITLPEECSELKECENNLDVQLPNDPKEFISIGNQNAISIIHFNSQIIGNEPMMGLLSFVTDSNFSLAEAGDFRVRSNVFNQLIRGRLLPIKPLATETEEN